MAVTKDLGMVTAYAYAVSKGYTGTEDEFAELMASYAEVAEQAAESAEQAAASERNAHTYSQTAVDKALEASGYATTATNKASEAAASASSASDSAATATQKASDASASATAAANSASAAAGSATNAGNSASAAASSATAANTAKAAAETAQGKAEDAQEAAEAAAEQAEQTLSSYAKVDGSYVDMTVGNAEQLVATVGIEDSVPYTFRTSGGSADIGDRETDMVVGGTIAWNQLTYDGNFTSADNWAKQSANPTLVVANNEITVTLTDGDNNASVYNPAFRMKDVKYNFVKDHIYLFTFDFKPSKDGTPYYRVDAFGGSLLIANAATANTWKHYDVMRKCSTANEVYGYWGQANAAGTLVNGDSISYRKMCVFDLTQMFGSTVADYIYSLEQANAGAGVAFFRKLFPKPYYEYNAGELLSVNASAHKMVEFNAFDKSKATHGYKILGTGQLYADSTVAVSDYIKVVPNSTYYASPNWQTGLNVIFFYNTDKELIGKEAKSTHLYTTPADCAYVRLNMLETEVDTACFNLSWSGSRNGEYEPYVEHTYPLDSSLTLRGIPKLSADNTLYYDGDTYESDGKVTRKYGVVDLGTLAWQYVASGGNNERFQSAIPGIVPVSNSDVAVVAICSKYPVAPWGNLDRSGHDQFFCRATVANVVAIRDTTYSDLQSFLSSISGVQLVYELATPTEETADPYQNPQIVNDFGTEEYIVTEQNGVAVPVGHVTTYPANLRDKLQHLPDLADADGYYMIQQTNNEMSLTRFRIPQAPTSDGEYILKATVSGGTPTYTWEANA